jgi:hypothetical protein
LAGIQRQLSDVQAELDALGFAGKIVATMKGDELTQRKTALTKAVRARRAELMEGLNVQAKALVSKGVTGDPQALEAIALAVQQEPTTFPAGLLDRLLGLMVGALSTSATLVCDALVG